MPGRTSAILEPSRRVAQRIQQLGGMRTPYHMEVLGCPQARTGPNRPEDNPPPDAGACGATPALKWIHFDQRLSAVIESYDEYDDILDYLKVIGCMMGC